MLFWNSSYRIIDVTNNPTLQNQFKEGRVYLSSQLADTVPYSGEVTGWGWRLVVTLYLSESRERWVLLLKAFLLFIQCRTPAQGVVLPTVKVELISAI